RRPRCADARVTGLGTVAGIAVAAPGTVGTQGPRHAHAAPTDVVVGAGVAGVAARALRQGSTRLADPALTDLGAIACVAVAARGTVDDRRVLAPEHLVARIDRAGAGVGAIHGCPRQADPALAPLRAVTDVAIGAVQVGHADRPRDRGRDRQCAA